MSFPILVVDDDQDILELYRLILEDAGYIVDTAICGKEAISKALENNYNLALLDFVLPDIKGTDIAKELYLRERINSVLFVTGYSHIFDFIEPEYKHRCKVLLKPVSGNLLIESVREAVETGDTITVEELVTPI